jgi:hypothetical protein
VVEFLEEVFEEEGEELSGTVVERGEERRGREGEVSRWRRKRGRKGTNSSRRLLPT